MKLSQNICHCSTNVFPGRGIYYVFKFSNLNIVMYQVLLPARKRTFFLPKPQINTFPGNIFYAE